MTAISLHSFHMDCFFWICRGTTSSDFIVVLFDLIILHTHALLILVETKVYSMARVLSDKLVGIEFLCPRLWGFLVVFGFVR